MTRLCKLTFYLISKTMKRQPALLLIGLLSLLTTQTTYAQSWEQLTKLNASVTNAADYFGEDVAISGNYAVVGAVREDEDENEQNTLNSSGSAYIFKKNTAGNWILKQKIVASNRVINGEFGLTVAISGDYIAVGSARKDNNRGSVYIFKRDNTTDIWSQTQELRNSDQTNNLYFGTDIAMSGDYLIASTNGYRDASGGSFMIDAGAAYLFQKNSGGTWTQQKKIVPLDRQSGDKFGQSVAISGTRAIVGAYWEGEDVTGSNTKTKAGSAYIFELTSGNWTQTAKLVASDRAAGDEFGVDVSIDSNFAVIGARYGDGTPAITSAGSAYVFERSSTGSWSQTQKLVADNRFAEDEFGTAVSISDSLIIVGSPRHDRDRDMTTIVADQGAVYVYAKDAVGSGWTQLQKMVTDDRAAQDRIGEAIAIDNENILVATRFKAGAAGAAYIFNYFPLTTWNGSSWDNGTPVAHQNALINGHYNVASQGNITADSITVSAGFTLAVDASGSVIANKISNNGTITTCGGTVSGTIAGNAVQSNTVPAITTQPADQSVVVGQTATFAVTATGSNLSYQWIKGSTNTGGNMASYTTPATTMADNGSTYKVEINNTCGIITSNNTTLTVTAPPVTTTTWNGTMWSNGTPAANIKTIIDSDYSGPGFNTDTLIINSGVSFSPSSNVTATGQITNSGNTTGGTGFIVTAPMSSRMNTQAVQGRFSKLRIGATDARALSDSTFVTEILDIDGILGTNNVLVLESNSASQCACLDALTSSSTLLDNVTVERQLPTGSGRYFYAGTPVKNQTLANWQDDVTNMSQMYTYNAITATNDGWVAATATTNLIQGKGIIFMASSAKLKNTGEITSGNGVGNNAGFFNFGVTYDENGYKSNGLAGWNLIANPYPCTIDWNLMSKTAIENTFWIWDGTGYQFYQAVGNTTGGSNSGSGISANGHIPSGAAFFVRAASNSATLSTEEADKVATSSPSVLSTTASDRLGMTLYKQDTSCLNGGTCLSDRSYIRFDNQATTGYDTDADLVKLNNPMLNLSSYQTAGHNLAINALPFGQTSVKLSVTGEAGTYSLNFDGLGSFAAGSQFFLQDKLLNTITDLTTQPNYNFSITNNVASQGNDRFEIVTVPMAITGLSNTNNSSSLQSQVSVYPNPAHDFMVIHVGTLYSTYRQTTYSLISATGKIIKSGQLISNTQRVETTDLSAGVHILQVRTQNEIVTQKIVIK